MILLLLAWIAAAGGLRVHIDATVADDLTSIAGTLTVKGEPTALQVVDPLVDLPEPMEDRTFSRTWRGRQRPGQVQFERVEPGVWRFQSQLPRNRFGDVGAWKKRRLYANGAWYPQPLIDGRPPVMSWEVHVRLPDGATGVLGDQAGQGRLQWSGEGERASLAVLARARVHALDDGLQVVDAHRSRRFRRIQRRDPATLLRRGLGEGVEVRPAVLVVAPLRRRLARPGVGTLYLSDRAWRLTEGLRGYHDGAVQHGLIQASLPIADPFDRALAASIFAATAEVPDPRGLLRWFSWNPVIDAILNDRRMPFWGDVFQAAHPYDPLRDDLIERYDGHAPTRALAGQLLVQHDRDTLHSLAQAIVEGEAPQAAAERLHVPAGLIEGWRQPYPEQDYRLIVSQAQIEVQRDAPDDATPELVQVRVDGEVQTLRFDRGPGAQVLGLQSRPRRVVLDPHGLARQSSRVGDAWPPRVVLLWAAWIDAINVTEGFISGHALAWARGRDDNRNTAFVWIGADQQDLPAITLGWQHRRGPPQDGLARPHRLGLSVTPAWSNPAFAEGDSAVFTVQAAASYAWDTRISALFPLRGRRLFVGVSGGVAPYEGTRWGRASAELTGLLSPHPRWAFVARGAGAIATGDTRQRLLWLGGPRAGVSLRPGIEIGTQRGVAELEWRWAPVRQASVPLAGLAWLSGVQLTAGAEGVVLRREDGGPASLVGLTAGLAGVADILGANPGLVGITAGLPACVRGVTDEEGQPVQAWQAPQVSLRFGQAF